VKGADFLANDGSRTSLAQRIAQHTGHEVSTKACGRGSWPGADLIVNDKDSNAPSTMARVVGLQRERPDIVQGNVD